MPSWRSLGNSLTETARETQAVCLEVMEEGYGLSKRMDDIACLEK
jgi:hypothetical protein